MFTGGISNTGLISAGGSAGGLPIGLGAVGVGGLNSFAGGIFNASGGVISAKSIGVAVAGNATFSGGILNRGTIAAGQPLLRSWEVGSLGVREAVACSPAALATAAGSRPVICRRGCYLLTRRFLPEA